MTRKPSVVLYNPKSVFFTLPLGLLSVGSALDSDRFDVRILDGRLGDSPVEHLDGAICVGMSVLTGAPIRDALRVSRQIKRVRPDLPVVWGGWHPSLFPLETLDEPAIDVTVQAQGERTFEELVDALAAGRDLASIRGISYRAADGVVRRNAPREMEDMNTLPPHRYDLLPLERYFALKGRRQLDYISSTGCFWRCAFCADPFVYKRQWTAVSPERIGDEIEQLTHRYHVEEVAFQDETFFTYVKRSEAVADEFRKRDLRIDWTATMRADQGARLSDDSFGRLAASGLRRVLIGVESGSQEMIDWMSKDITLEQVADCAEKCLRHGVGAIFPFIVGFPDESDESVRSSMGLAKRLRSMSPTYETPFFYFKPYPGSKITQQLVENGYRHPKSLDAWAAFDFIGSSGPWVSREKRRLIERFKFYNRAAGSAPSFYLKPLRTLARWRCRHDCFAFPIEKGAAEWLWPQMELS